jgi:tetrahydromethanopterin S-methyltransferase subunit F
MDERRTARVVGLSLGVIFAAVLVLNALASF